MDLQNVTERQSRPDISVVVPVYNVQQPLLCLVDSLLNQSLKNFEVVFVNDGSSKATSASLEKIVRTNSRFRLVAFDENKGAHEARRAGVLECRGRWIAFADADDVLSPFFLDRMFNVAVQTDSDIVVCSADKISISGEPAGRQIQMAYEEKIDREIFHRFCALDFGGTVWNKLYKYQLILPHLSKHFRWRQDIGEDALVNLGCFSEARQTTTLSDVLYHYRQHPGNITKKFSSVELYVQVLRAFSLALDVYVRNNPELLPDVLRLYVHQLRYNCCKIEQLKDLDAHRAQITEALGLIAQISPHAIAALPQTCNFLPEPRLSSRQALVNWKKSTIDVVRIFGEKCRKKYLSN